MSISLNAKRKKNRSKGRAMKRNKITKERQAVDRGKPYTKTSKSTADNSRTGAKKERTTSKYRKAYETRN